MTEPKSKATPMEFEQLLKTNAWSTIKDVVSSRIKKDRDLLESCSGEELAKIQGEIVALRFVLNLPQSYINNNERRGTDVE